MKKYSNDVLKYVHYGDIIDVGITNIVGGSNIKRATKDTNWKNLNWLCEE